MNFAGPGSYHLYFGDDLGRPGAAITLFEWAGATTGNPGVGGTHHLALTVPDYAVLVQWRRRIRDLGVTAQGPCRRESFVSISFSDLDGTNLEINSPDAGGVNPTELFPDPVPEINQPVALNLGIHYIAAFSSNLDRTHEFFSGLLGLQVVRAATRQWS